MICSHSLELLICTKCIHFEGLSIDLKVSVSKIFISYFQQGDFDKASSILHIALRMAQDMNHLDGVTYIYNLLADMAFERVSSLNV